jgi:alkylated DNA repair dioxygenase AlkB
MPARHSSPDPRQAGLFSFSQAPPVLPPGLVYQPDFLSPAEERRWLAVVGTLPLHEAQYKSHTARRRVVSYGGSFDYDSNRLLPSEPLPEVLEPLRHRVAGWLRIAPDRLVHALVAEYRPGTPLGWHRDVPDFDLIAGVSLGGPGVLRLRPYPPDQPRRADIVHLDVAPRSIYRMSAEARWDWQHSVPPTEGERWSVTFRTAV